MTVIPIPLSHDLAAILPEPLALVVLCDPSVGIDLSDVYRALPETFARVSRP